ncbi:MULTISPECIES: polyprenyl synthetase family protein [unclassified Kitasatospora]|uniref:polyprenyl synthetase family protein n=1 Tax=unclassified Kitasatospora TaxID=2633591 RepID=UPI00070C5A8D|nr:MULTISPECIES: polyprenyl synthetase family protein [unclassified Kitasatospora]KQV18610.1 polyprenyl synthetase [Kitasatospora sp. Root107]KRB74592.1 polyprenyl synthetase [Kitasatospora sp. Root187]
MAEPVRDPTLKSRIDEVLRAFVEEEAGLLVAIDVQLKPVADQLQVAVADGKRLRAAFAYWGWRAAGQPDSEAMVRAAAAMELVHAAAVVHDDLIDESPIRRGAPTAHLALRHAVAEGPGRDASGRALAMLVGDLLMSWAGQLFAGCGLPAAYLARARPLWATLARELVAGECLEILRTRAAPSAASSLEIVRYKTAKYTVEHPLHLGGRLAGAPPALLDAFTAYGVPLGEAFQLRDDLLGVFGDPRRTGKSNLDDLAGAKPTALLALTLTGAAEADRARLRALLGRADLGPAELDELRDIMIRSGARTRVEELITQRAAAARTALGRAALPPQAATALAELIAAATTRTS